MTKISGGPKTIMPRGGNLSGGLPLIAMGFSSNPPTFEDDLPCSGRFGGILWRLFYETKRVTWFYVLEGWDFDSGSRSWGTGGLDTFTRPCWQIVQFSLNRGKHLLNLFSFLTVFWHTLTYPLPAHRAVSTVRAAAWGRVHGEMGGKLLISY